MSKFELIALGRFSLADIEGTAPREIAVAAGKARALLLYVAMAEQPVARDHLLDLLWPHLPAEAARGNLRLLLSKLRRVCVSDKGAALLDITRYDVGVHSSRARIDAKQLLDGAAPTDDVWSHGWGELAPGLHVPECRDFEDWLTSLRERVLARQVSYLEQRVASFVEHGEIGLALAAARCRCKLQPHSDAALRALMRLLVTHESAHSAAVEYAAFRARLWKDLGAEPEMATQKLADEFRTRSLEAGQQQEGTTSPGPAVCIYGEIADRPGDAGDIPSRLMKIQAQFRRALAEAGGIATAEAPWRFQGYLAAQRSRHGTMATAVSMMMAVHDELRASGIPSRWGIRLSSSNWLADRPDRHGTMVRLAQRFALLAEPGEAILCAKASRYLPERAPLLAAGTHRFRGLPRAVKVYRLKLRRL